MGDDRFDINFIKCIRSPGNKDWEIIWREPIVVIFELVRCQEARRGATLVVGTAAWPRLTPTQHLMMLAAHENPMPLVARMARLPSGSSPSRWAMAMVNSESAGPMWPNSIKDT